MQISFVSALPNVVYYLIKFYELYLSSFKDYNFPQISFSKTKKSFTYQNNLLFAFKINYKFVCINNFKKK